MNKSDQIRTLFRRMLMSILLGTAMAFLGVLLEVYVEGHNFSAFDSLDQGVTGVLAALLVFAYEQRQHRSIVEKVRVIAEMNHHVRNALQVIMCSKVISQQDVQLKVIRDAAGRIEWALQEFLPRSR
jgi:hypothetical protein